MKRIIVGLALMFSSIFIGSYLFHFLKIAWLKFPCTISFITIGLTGIVIALVGVDDVW